MWGKLLFIESFVVAMLLFVVILPYHNTLQQKIINLYANLAGCKP